jgi:hypothetical protein
MPTALKTVEILSLDEYTKQIAAVSPAHGHRWYRGCGDSSHRLVPSLFRHPTITTAEDLLKLERKLLGRFRQRCIPYLVRPLENDWEYVFLMQHFGVPTRLLDWTENPFIALFFALTSVPRHRATGAYEADAAIWALDPIGWNERALKHISFDGILSAADKPADGYAQGTEIALMNSDPVALYGAHNSPRIVAQRGVFTIFGKSTKAMEQTFADADYPVDTLRKYVVPKAAIESLLKAALSIGIADSVIFPDLDGLAREIKRSFEFTV